jgi:hypothetical protein
MKPKHDTDKATVVIGKALHAELRIAAAATPSLTIRDIVTDACREWLNARRSKKMK